MGVNLDQVPPKKEDSKWTIEKRDLVIETQWNSYIHDHGKTDSGKPFDYYYIHNPIVVAVIALTEKQELILVRQYRYPINMESLEIPGGSGEEGQSYETVAKNELLEETGYEAKSMIQIGEFAANGGISNEITRVYLASGCRQVSEQKLEESEKGMKVELHQVDQVFEMVQEAKIKSGFTLAALMIAWPHIL